MISTLEAAKILNITPQYLRQLLQKKELFGKKVGGVWVVSKESVLKYQKEKGGAVPPDKIRAKLSHRKVNAISFFSGALGLDIGLEKAGINILAACENNKYCRQTITKNRPNLALMGDILKYSAQEIRQYARLDKDQEIELIVGGPPCQAFSTAGSRRGFRDKRGSVFLHYLDLLKQLRPRYAVIENVRGLLSSPLNSEKVQKSERKLEHLKGSALNYALDFLEDIGYKISFNLYNAANFGVPQSRERLIIICSRESEVPFLNPTASNDATFGLPRWKTLRDAISDIPLDACDYINFPEKRLKYFRLLKAGQYWKHLPENIQAEALGKSYKLSGGRTGFLRRLAWDKPSCTLVTSPTMPATDMCHPEELRPLSVQEYKRIQQFPDDFEICGPIHEQYRQLGNAVPVGLGEAVGKAILSHLKKEVITPPENFPFSRYHKTSHHKIWKQEWNQSKIDFQREILF